MRHSLMGAFALMFCVTANAQFNEAAKTQAVAMVTDKGWTPKQMLHYPLQILFIG